MLLGEFDNINSENAKNGKEPIRLFAVLYLNPTVGRGKVEEESYLI